MPTLEEAGVPYHGLTIANALFGESAYQNTRGRIQQMLINEFRILINSVLASYWQRGRKAVTRDVKKMAGLKDQVRDAWAGKLHIV